jgi:two-component system sensor histidine kinase/response regulator
VVTNGIEALAALGSSSYDVVLMDVQMPEMGGIEATRIIREREAATGHHTRIVALTAHAMAGDRERYLGAGMDGYLSKPIDPGTLFAAVEQRQPLIERRRSDVWSPDASPLSLEEMRRRLGGDELVAEVVEMFLTDCPERMAHIKAAVAARDRDAIRSAAHALKGAAGNLAATPVTECAGALESMAADGAFDPIRADATFARLEVESARLVSALRDGLMSPLRSVEP